MKTTTNTQTLYKSIEEQTGDWHQSRITRSIHFTLTNKDDLPYDVWQFNIYTGGQVVFINQDTIDELCNTPIKELINLKMEFSKRTKKYLSNIRYYNKEDERYYFVRNDDVARAFYKTLVRKLDRFENGKFAFSTKLEKVPELKIESDKIYVEAHKPQTFEFDVPKKEEPKTLLV